MARGPSPHSATAWRRAAGRSWPCSSTWTRSASHDGWATRASSVSKVPSASSEGGSMFGLISTPGEAEPVQLREVEDPRPSEDEALVEVKAFGVNRGELFLLAERDGWRPGQDVAGVVLQPAASGRGPGAGARVVACVDGGGWAQRVAAPVTRMAGLPDSVSFSAAATLPVAGLTALRALREVGDLLGRRVLVTGASGGVGHFGVQLAAIGGAPGAAGDRFPLGARPAENGRSREV